MINVLWVDDRCKDNGAKLYNEMSDLAADYDIKITAYQNYGEALDELASAPKKWNAIILDICDDRATKGGLADGFNNAIEQILKFQTKNNQEEPYIFVFSGSDLFATEEQQMAIRKRDYAKRVYRKGSIEDTEQMFNDIKKICEVSNLYQLQQEYQDVLIAVKELEWHRENIEVLWKIILHKNSDASLLNDMRKLLEGEIMRKFNELDIFPEDCRMVAAQSRYIEKRTNAPVYIKRAFHSLSEITNDGSHALQNKGTTWYVQNRKAPYLLKSCMFELFNIIIWQSDLFRLNSDEKIKEILEKSC